MPSDNHDSVDASENGDGSDGSVRLGLRPFLAGVASHFADWRVWLTLLWFFWLFGFLYYLGARTDDDAFIFLRYARNIVDGRGYVWNPVDGPVEGITSGLWLGLLTLAGRLGLPMLAFAKFVGILSLGLSVGLLWRLLRDLASKDVPEPGGSAWVAAMLAFSHPDILLCFTNGMETGLNIAILLAMLIVASRIVRAGMASFRAMAGLSVLCLLSCLARPDGVAYSAMLLLWVFLHMCARNSQSAVRLVAAAALFLAVPGMLYMTWRITYFGDWLPNPYYVKSTNGPAQMGFFLGGFVRDEFIWLVFILPLFACRKFFRSATAIALLGFPAVSTAVCAWTNDASLGGGLHRYLAPALVCLHGLAVFAAIACINGSLRDGALRNARTPLLLVCAALIGTNSFPPAYDALRARDWFRRTMEALHRDFTSDVGAAISGTSHEVLVRDAGQAWYLMDRGVVDLYGLNDPFIARHSWFRGDNRKVILDYIYGQRKPAVLLLAAWSGDGRSGSLVPEVAADGRFSSDYDFLGSKKGPAPVEPLYREGRLTDGYYMLLALRRDVPDFPALSVRLRALCDPAPTP